MTQEPEMMTDMELDTLLAHASKPPLPLGARQRLMAKLSDVESDAIDMRRHSKIAAPSHLGWLTSLPLAASLALGIYIGSGGGLENVLPTAAYDVLAGASASADDPLTGIEEMESFSEDDLS